MSDSTILEQIIEHKHQEIAAAKSRVSFDELERSFPAVENVRGFAAALRDRIGQRQAAVIAEIKKASPSRGLIRDDFDPALLAKDYAANGATCLSILTDEKFFQGCNEDLQAARAACDLPVIRKDFMVDVYQIAESRSLGADCILLIVAALQQSQMEELAAYANDIAIDILVEVHDQQELERALSLETDLLGINNRNLHTFETKLQTTLELVRNVPAGKLIITESGINSADDVKLMLDHGIFGFLIGESCMRAHSPGDKLRELIFGNE